MVSPKMIKGVGSVFRDRRVLVTGHTGFKGSWLTVWLKSLGANVSGISLSPAPGYLNLFEEANIAEGINSRICDIRDRKSVLQLVKEVNPEFVFHLAAQSLVRESYAAPVETFETNVIGTVNILEALRGIRSLKGVLVVTADKCYENREWHWGYRETDAMGGHDPYSASKGCAELVTASYRRSFYSEENSALIASARAGNVIGGGDWAVDRLIPDLIRGATADKHTLVRYPQATRPWQHVLDALGGYLKLAEKLWSGDRSFADAWNFGPTDADIVSVSKVIELAQQAWPAIKVKFPNTSEQFLHEAALLKLDSSKSRSLLHWSPVWDLTQAVENTISWYCAYDEQRKSTRVLMEEQIEAFAKKLN